MIQRLPSGVRFPVLALLAELIGLGFFGLSAFLIHGSAPFLPYGMEGPLSLVGLACSGVLAGILAAIGLYQLHAYRPMWLAVPVTLLIYLPILAVAAVSTWLFLVFLGVA